MSENALVQDYGVFPMLEWRCLAGDTLYFVQDFGNCVYAYHLPTGHLKVLGFLTMPQEDYEHRPPIGAMEKCGDYLAVAPSWGNLFHLFNLRTGACRNIPSPTQGPRQYDYALLHGDEVIFIRWSRPGIARMQVPQGTLRYDDSFADTMMSYGQSEDNWGRINCAIIVQDEDGRDMLYMVNVNNPWLMFYDLTNGDWHFERIPGVADDNGFAEIYQSGTWLYLTSRNTGVIIKWNRQTGEYHTLANPEGWQPRGAYIKFIDGRLFSMHCDTLAAFRENPAQERLEAIHFDRRIKLTEPYNPWHLPHLFWFEPYGGQLYFFFMGENVVYRTDYGLQVTGTLPVRLEAKDWRQYQQYLYDQCVAQKFFLERDSYQQWTVEKFVQMLKYGQHKAVADREIVPCGTKIYREITRG